MDWPETKKRVMNLLHRLVLLSGAKRREKDFVLPKRNSGSETREAKLGKLTAFCLIKNLFN